MKSRSLSACKNRHSNEVFENRRKVMEGGRRKEDRREWPRIDDLSQSVALNCNARRSMCHGAAPTGHVLESITSTTYESTSVLSYVFVAILMRLMKREREREEGTVHTYVTCGYHAVMRTNNLKFMTFKSNYLTHIDFVVSF